MDWLYLLTLFFIKLKAVVVYWDNKVERRRDIYCLIGHWGYMYPFDVLWLETKCFLQTIPLWTQNFGFWIERKCRKVDCGELLDCSKLDNLESLARISRSFDGEDDNNRFRLTCHTMKRLIKERTWLHGINLANEHELDAILTMSERYDVDVAHVATDIEDFDTLSKLPASIMIVRSLYCFEPEPSMLRFINPKIKELNIFFFPEQNYSYSFGLKDVLDRLDDMKELILDTFCYADSSDWANILLQWLIAKNSHKKIDEMHLGVEHSDADADLDYFLSVIQKYVKDFQITLKWTQEEIDTMRLKFPNIQFLSP